MRKNKISLISSVITITMTISFIVCLILESRLSTYTNWGNGEKVLTTNAIVENCFVDENNDAYSQFLYDVDGKTYEKWVQVNDYEEYQKLKSEHKIYYLASDPDAMFRLTNPYEHNGKENEIKICGTVELVIVIILVVNCVFSIVRLMLSRKNIKSKESKKNGKR